MTLEQRLGDEMKDAMRQKDVDRLACVRQVRAKAQEAMNAPDWKGPADDAFYQRIIGSYVKMLEKSLGEFAQAGDKGKALTDKYQKEITYLRQYLPQQLGEPEVKALVAAAIQTLGATSKKQVGQVVGAIMKEHKGKVDPGLVKQLVEQALPG
jgi:uncharacterized protein